jgi:hypothetical protein
VAVHSLDRAVVLIDMLRAVLQAPTGSPTRRVPPYLAEIADILMSPPDRFGCGRPAIVHSYGADAAARVLAQGLATLDGAGAGSTLAMTLDPADAASPAQRSRPGPARQRAPIARSLLEGGP